MLRVQPHLSRPIKGMSWASGWCTVAPPPGTGRRTDTAHDHAQTAEHTDHEGQKVDLTPFYSHIPVIQLSPMRR